MELNLDRRRIVHDLNNQLVAVAGNCELSLMTAEARTSAQLRDSLEKALAAAGAAASLASLLSAEARAEDGR
jgi:hypothetical protein